MMITRNERRLKAVGHYYPLLNSKQCSRCGNSFIREKMWHVLRYGPICGRTYDHFYCLGCCPTKGDVLTEIDIGLSPWGIAFVDSPSYVAGSSGKREAEVAKITEPMRAGR